MFSSTTSIHNTHHLLVLCYHHSRCSVATDESNSQTLYHFLDGLISARLYYSVVSYIFGLVVLLRLVLLLRLGLVIMITSIVRVSPALPGNSWDWFLLLVSSSSSASAAASTRWLPMQFTREKHIFSQLSNHCIYDLSFRIFFTWLNSTHLEKRCHLYVPSLALLSTLIADSWKLTGLIFFNGLADIPVRRNFINVFTLFKVVARLSNLQH